MLEPPARAWARARRCRANWRTLFATICSAVGPDSEAERRWGSRANSRSRDSFEAVAADAGGGAWVPADAGIRLLSRFINRKSTSNMKVKQPARKSHRHGERELSCSGAPGFPGTTGKGAFTPY